MIVADFSKTIGNLSSGTINEDLISGLDLGTSSLALADIVIPSYMEGQNMFIDSYERDYVVSSRDRCDFTIDRIRSVRSKEYKYIRNFKTDRPYTQPTYMDFDGIEFVQVMHQLYDDKKLNVVQSRFMSDERPEEELYNLQEDPYELNNLATNSEYSIVLKEYSQVLNNWIAKTDDKGQYPENEENLKLMLGIWGEHAVNPEYDALRIKFPNLAGSLTYLKTESSKLVN